VLEVPRSEEGAPLEKGDRYFQKAQYREAVLEYRNALSIDNQDARTNRQLGLALSQAGEVSRAYPYLLRASQANPADIDVNLKLGTIYLLAGKTEDARARADLVLEKEPGRLEALVLLANASISAPDLDAALPRVLQQREAHRGRQTFTWPWASSISVRRIWPRPSGSSRRRSGWSRNRWRLTWPSRISLRSR